jgi:acetylornithine deacetylase
VVFGPGNPVIAHGSNEHVELEEVVNAAKILAVALLRWCNGEEGFAVPPRTS